MWLGPKRLAIWGGLALAGLGACALAVLALGGYFGSESRSFTPDAAIAAPRPGTRPQLVAVFWSGDMGLRIGFGSDLPGRLARRGIPVLAVSSPALFGTGRSPAFARDAVAGSLAEAIRRSGARQVVLIGFSFGADVIAATIGQLDPALRQQVAQVVLVGPGTGIHFHANPFGLFYGGPSEADPRAVALSLRGLRLSCIFAAGDGEDSLCRQPALRQGRLTGVADGHMMLAHREEVTRAVVRAVLHPAEPLP